jgi:signal peptidase I
VGDARAPAKPDGRGILGVALIAILVGGALTLGLRTAGIHLARVTSNSMAPAVRVGDWVLEQDIRRAASQWVQRGDVVVFRFPFGSERRAIKRVFGLPGDRIVVGRRAISLNGATVLAHDTPGYGASEQRAHAISAGAVFLLGDNAGASIDSRYFGPVIEQDVVGRVLLMLPAGVFWSVIGVALALAIGALSLARIGGPGASGA